MFRISFSLIILTVLGFSSPKKQITIYMAGDSTMAFKPKTEHPERGWGMLLPEFFDDKVVIDNHARNGRSSKSFMTEGLWKNIMDKVQRGDYVVIQFGHNDSSPDKGPDRYSTPDEYKANLIKYVNDTRAKRAKPILCTPIMRRRFDENGKFYDLHGVYPDVVREVADSLKVPLVDMHRMSENVIVEHGEAGSEKIFLHIQPGEYEVLPDGLTDDTHFSEYGARIMAGLFAESIKKSRLKLSKYLK